MLQFTKRRLGVAGLAAIAVTCLALTATPAFADPIGSTPTNPPTSNDTSLIGVGSDTTQDVVNGLASQISSVKIASYDAVTPGTGAIHEAIQTRTSAFTPAGRTFVRPNGSGDGIKTLSDAMSGGVNKWNSVDVTGQVDFARSSSGPSASFPGTDLTFIPFAQDAVTYMVNAASDFPRNLPKGSASSPNQLSLYSIYNCKAGGASYTDSNLNPVTIRPLVPQSGSGTRKFFLGNSGVAEDPTGSGNVTVSCGANTPTDLSNTVEEHNGNFVTGAGDIAPISIAQYISQGAHAAILSAYGVNVTERRGLTVLGSINTVSPVTFDSNGKAVMNSSTGTPFPISRLVYNVVPTSKITSGNAAFDQRLVTAFVGSSSAMCSQASVIAAFGFATIGNGCGATTATQGYQVG